MPTYSFTLQLESVSNITDKLEDDLYELGCDDALISSIGDRVYLDFDREAPSLDSAVASAVVALNSSGYKSFLWKEAK